MRPHISTLTSSGQTTVKQYSIQTANGFAALSNLTESWQSKRSAYSSNYAQPQRGVPNINNKKFTGRQGKKSSSLDHRKHTHVNPNLASSRMNENKQSCTPTIVNGVTSVTSILEHKQEDSAPLNYSITHLINKRSEQVIIMNETKCTLSKNHKIVLIGDSHIRGYANSLKPLLNSDYEFYGVVKPGSSSSELMFSASEEIKGLSQNDLVVVCSGSNDYSLNEFSSTFQNIKNFLSINNHTNILLMNIPCRYDIPNSLSINKNISTLNKRLKKLIKAFPHSSFLEIRENRIIYTKHGLHRSKLEKKLVNLQLAQTFLTIFSLKSDPPIPVDWQAKDDSTNPEIDIDIQNTFSRKPTHIRRTPMTRPNAFSRLT